MTVNKYNGLVSFLIPLAIALSLQAQVTSPPAAPTNLRADISVGTTGQLFVSWSLPRGATFYNLQRSTSPATGFAVVSNCSGPGKAGDGICRDPGLVVGTRYYYRVQACNSYGCSSFATSTNNSNTPVYSNCSAQQIPDVSKLPRGPLIAIPTLAADPAALVWPSQSEYASPALQTIPRKNILVVELPGSGGPVCGE
jgi:hypothetical protein